MAPLIVLVVVTLPARLAGQLGVRPLRDRAAATRVGLAVMLCFTAAAHFNAMRADLVRMVPPAVPNPELMVTFTGNTFVVMLADGSIAIKGTFKLDPARRPKIIDWTDTFGRGDRTPGLKGVDLGTGGAVLAVPAGAVGSGGGG